jgi:hypothetical protein
MFFQDQTEEALINAVSKTENAQWDADVIREYAKEFDYKIAKEKFETFITERYDEFQKNWKS